MPKLFVLHGSLDVVDGKKAETVSQKLKEINSRVDAFVVASNHAASSVENLCGFKPRVIHHGVDISIFNPFNVSKEKARGKLLIPKDKKVILWVGRIDPVKNLSMMINALLHIVREEKGVLLLVKGRAVDETYFRKILASIRELGLTKHVRLDIKWSTSMSMVYYYRAADIFYEANNAILVNV